MNEPIKSAKPKSMGAAAPLLLILAIVAVFGQMVQHDFVSWDDPITIAANPRLHPPSWNSVAWYWTHAEAGLYVPLTYTVWELIAALLQFRGDGAMPLDPAAFHTASVVLHTLSALLVLNLLHRLLGRRGPAVVGALIFALHPLQVESVAWASGLKDVLSGFLAIAAIDQYVRFAKHQSRTHYLFACGLTILAMLAKPSAAIVPVLMAAIDRWIIGRDFRRVLKSTLPILLLLSPLIVVARIVQKSYASTHTPPWTRPLIAMDSLAFYLSKLLIPWPLTLSYGRTPGAVLASGALYWTWILPVAIGIAIVLNRRRSRPLFLGAILFAAGLLPVLGLTNFSMQSHSTVADHYMYLPMLGIVLAAAWITERVWALRLSAVLVLALACLSIQQARYWRDGLTLFSHAVATTPENDDALQGLGNALAQAGQIADAVPYFARAVQHNPTSAVNQELLTQSLVFTGRYEEALPHAYEALRLLRAQGESATAQLEFLLGRALAQTGRASEAESHLAEAVRQQPADPNLASELQSVRRKIAASSTSP